MIRLLTSFLLLFVLNSSFAQSFNPDEIKELGNYYSSNMFGPSPAKAEQKKLGLAFQPAMAPAVHCVKEMVVEKNTILSTEFLKAPDDYTLKVMYMVDELHQNPHRYRKVDPDFLIDSLIQTEIPRHALIDNYYGMIFVTSGNKNQPFNMSKIDFQLDEYGLKDEQERGIFFLLCMEACGTQIFGFMNIVQPPNTKKALEYIAKFPKFNGKEYYEFKDLQFADFEMQIYNDRGIESYKSVYIHKYFEVLLNHMVCLDQEGMGQDAMRPLMLNSVLQDRSLYPYTSYKELLESVFAQ